LLEKECESQEPNPKNLCLSVFICGFTSDWNWTGHRGDLSSFLRGEYHCSRRSAVAGWLKCYENGNYVKHLHGSTR